MITVAVTYPLEDQMLVSAFDELEPDEQHGSYWSDPALDDLRSRVKTYYIAAQGYRCCYCNRHLGTDNHRMWDVEHVASRVDHPRFMFEPHNLAAACPDCNMRKSEKDPIINKEALVNKNLKKYPMKSASFRICHPHFDVFEDHIYQRGMVYLGKTDKGKNTIYACDLLRFAQKYIEWENSAADTRFEKEIDTVFNDGTIAAEEMVGSLIAQLNER